MAYTVLVISMPKKILNRQFYFNIPS